MSCNEYLEPPKLLTCLAAQFWVVSCDEPYVSDNVCASCFACFAADLEDALMSASYELHSLQATGLLPQSVKCESPGMITGDACVSRTLEECEPWYECREGGLPEEWLDETRYHTACPTASGTPHAGSSPNPKPKQPQQLGISVSGSNNGGACLATIQQHSVEVACENNGSVPKFMPGENKDEVKSHSEVAGTNAETKESAQLRDVVNEDVPLTTRFPIVSTIGLTEALDREGAESRRFSLPGAVGFPRMSASSKPAIQSTDDLIRTESSNISPTTSALDKDCNESSHNGERSLVFHTLLEEGAANANTNDEPKVGCFPIACSEATDVRLGSTREWGSQFSIPGAVPFPAIRIDHQPSSNITPSEPDKIMANSGTVASKETFELDEDASGTESLQQVMQIIEPAEHST